MTERGGTDGLVKVPRGGGGAILGEEGVPCTAGLPNMDGVTDEGVVRESDNAWENHESFIFSQSCRSGLDTNAAVTAVLQQNLGVIRDLSAGSDVPRKQAFLCMTRVQDAYESKLAGIRECLASPVAVERPRGLAPLRGAFYLCLASGSAP